MPVFDFVRLSSPTEHSIPFQLFDVFRKGDSCLYLHALSYVDPWHNVPDIAEICHSAIIG